jgi:predicted ATPase
MITKLELEDWKSYKTATLHIDALSVLIGTNSSGKSNALDALVFLSRLANGSPINSALQGDGAQSPLRGGIDWAPRRPGSTFAFKATFKFDEITDFEYRLECRVVGKSCDVEAEQLYRIKYRPTNRSRRGAKAGSVKLFWTDPCGEDAPNIVARLYNEKGGSPIQLGRSQAVLSQLSGLKLRQEIQEGLSEVSGSLKEIFVLDPIPSHMRSYSSLADRLDADAKNIAGVIAALPEVRRSDIEQTLTEYARQLPERDINRVYAEAVGKFRTDAMLYSEEHWTTTEKDPPTIDARGMSDGTLRLLAILVALLTRPEYSLLVIEEVDNGLHPSRAHLLLKMLREVGGQRKLDVLVTTHNPALLDAMGTEMVPFITVAHRNSRDDGSSSLTLLEDVTELPKLLAQGLVGRLSSQGLIEKSLAATNPESSEKSEPAVSLPGT